MIWAAVINSQGGLQTEEDADPRAVRPDEMFPSLADLFGGMEERDDSDALVAALKRQGALMRGDG